MSILQAFPAAPQQTKDDLRNRNKRKAIDVTAETIRERVPVPFAHTKEGALAWFKSLIPADKRRALEKFTAGEDWKVYFFDNYRTSWLPALPDLALALSNLVSEKKTSLPPSAYDNFQAITEEGLSWWQKREFRQHVYKHWNGIKRIAWRGDDRAPDKIMDEGCMGFQPRVSSTVPLWRPADGKWDVDTDTTVCVARDIRGSAFFPLNDHTNTYVYCVLVKEGWNTYYLQKKVAEADKELKKATKEKKKVTESQPYKDEVWMFHEKCAQHIAPEDVIAAFKIERQFHRTDLDPAPLAGIRFRLGEYRQNDAAWASLDQEQRNSILSTLREYAGHWNPFCEGFWLTYYGEQKASDIDSRFH
jgi:hypothetical protein